MQCPNSKIKLQPAKKHQQQQRWVTAVTRSTRIEHFELYSMNNVRLHV